MGHDYLLMPTWLKVILALALVLPLGAFVAGSLVASAADDPAPRDTIVIDGSGSTPTETPSTGTSPSSSSSPSTGPDEDDPEGVTPSYEEVDDDDERGDDGDHGDDGSGGGDD